MNHRARRVWINVTTSINWNRPAVGIVRVEHSLVEHLQNELGIEVCKPCIWNNDRFVEWRPGADQIARELIPPLHPTFDLVQRHLTGATRAGSVAEGGRSQSATGHLRDGHHADSQLEQPAPGDFLISVGLDWEYPYTSHFYELTRKRGLRVITCCYDLIPVLFPQYCVGDVSHRFAEYFLDLCWGSEAVLCISENTRRDFTQLCAKMGAPSRRTVVIPLGDNIPSGESRIGEAVRDATETPFILFVSTIERRKNHEVLYRAYHILKRQRPETVLPRLIFVGMPGWGVGDLLKDIELDPLTAGIILQLHHVSDAELEYLYRKALFCVYPSLYEGWGLPVGEALAMGKAVIASGEASLPEVGGDLVRYLSPWDPYAWADAIQDYVHHPETLLELEQRVKTNYRPRQWADTAKVVCNLIAELSESPDARPLSLLPGYDLSTESGIHAGPSIRTKNREGLLLFGPHYAMQKGRYVVHLLGKLLDHHRGHITCKVVSNGGRTIHMSQVYEFPLTQSAGNLALELPFVLKNDVDDLEIKCWVLQDSAIRFDKVIFDRVIHQRNLKENLIASV